MSIAFRYKNEPWSEWGGTQCVQLAANQFRVTVPNNTPLPSRLAVLPSVRIDGAVARQVTRVPSGNDVVVLLCLTGSLEDVGLA